MLIILWRKPDDADGFFSSPPRPINKEIQSEQLDCETEEKPILTFCDEVTMMLLIPASVAINLPDQIRWPCNIHFKFKFSVREDGTFVVIYLQ